MNSMYSGAGMARWPDGGEETCVTWRRFSLLTVMLQRIQLLGEPVHPQWKGAQEALWSRGRSDSGVSCHLHILLSWGPQAYPPRAVAGGKHPLALQTDQLALVCPGFSHVGTESPTSWETPVPPANWGGWSPYLGKPLPCWGHTQCHLREAERPTDCRIPPLAESGNPTLEESCCIKLWYPGHTHWEGSFCLNAVA